MNEKMFFLKIKAVAARHDLYVAIYEGAKTENDARKALAAFRRYTDLNDMIDAERKGDDK